MDVTEAIFTRKSIRGYKPDPVRREVIHKILEAALHAPSAMNTQPWEFFIITGEVLEQIRKGVVAKLAAGAPMNPDHAVAAWPRDSIYRKRQVELAKQLFTLMKIPREDKVKRAAWMERGYRFFDAPVGVVVVMDRMLGESGPLFDIGAAVQTLCLAALKYGLGTCIEDQAVLYPEVVRQLAGIPDSKRIMIAVALGYPDPDFPANRVQSGREPVDSVCTWIGFSK